ncbi:MAG: helix-turn-helix domain-containing protein [Chryseolinea sp.]
MADSNPSENEFLDQITAVIDRNLPYENFGVSELAEEMNMSRSNLLRKVKKLTKLSVSQLINQERLKRAMELLRKSSMNVSEVSHKVGFGSTSYFIKCFREYYGFPPGEVGKREASGIEPAPIAAPPQTRNYVILGIIGIVLAVTVGLAIYLKSASTYTVALEKSIAVLPFKNESNDSTNVYLINGLMEATLTNLQHIQALKVTSRTSTEMYRNSAKAIPEIGKELNVNYFIEGSGQKIGDKILLNIQLIEASTDRHLWAKQYRRESKDIFELQQEVAENIANEIQAIITPDERKNIEKNPTEDVIAYDLYLKGHNLFYQETKLDSAVVLFKKAIAQDPNFALAYGETAIVYYYKDLFQIEKKHANDLAYYSDKALLLDPNLPESLVAKALFYAVKKDFNEAVPYLNKALKLNPNSGLVLHFLSEFYYIHSPNTAKYLEYSLRLSKVDVTSKDSVTTGNHYLTLSNALFNAGFIDEATEYAKKSVSYNPKDAIAGLLRAYLIHIKDNDLSATKKDIAALLKKDTGGFFIAQEMGKICYLMRDYDSAYFYYKKYLDVTGAMQLKIFQHENLKIGIVYEKKGFTKEAQEYFKSYKEYADQSVYNHLLLAMYYAHFGDTKKVMEHMRLLAKQDNFQYVMTMGADEPVMSAVRDIPEFKTIMKEINTKFWNDHDKIKKSLEEKGLL